jgi:hypothetical protein
MVLVLSALSFLVVACENGETQPRHGVVTISSSIPPDEIGTVVDAIDIWHQTKQCFNPNLMLIQDNLAEIRKIKPDECALMMGTATCQISGVGGFDPIANVRFAFIVDWGPIIPEIIIHEFGHALAVQHNPDQLDVMYAYVPAISDNSLIPSPADTNQVSWPWCNNDLR